MTNVAMDPRLSGVRTTNRSGDAKTIAGSHVGTLDAKLLRQDKKKGPLAIASGPSLGRKRPRRAAIAQGATAPQQYAAAAHQVQDFSGKFPCKFRMVIAPFRHGRHNFRYKNQIITKTTVALTYLRNDHKFISSANF
jgi:hypothetical protein